MKFYYSDNNILMEKFVFRTPLLKISDLKGTETALLEAYKQDIVRNALFTASADLYYELLQLENGEITDTKRRKKIIISLYKYYARMCTRCTPFGYFSGICVGELSEENKIVLSDDITGTIRLDMDYLCNLYYSFVEDKILQQRLTFYPNNTLYPAGDQWRYVEYKLVNKVRFHNLVSIDNNEVLEAILTETKKGCTFNEIIAIVTDFGFDTGEAETYLYELIQNQVLLSELYPSVTGTDYQTRLFNLLEGLFPEKYAGIQATVNGILSDKKSSIIEKTAQLKDYLAAFNTSINQNKLIQVDLLKQKISCTLTKDIKQRLDEVATMLRKVSSSGRQTTLDRFKMAYYERYEGTFMPLAYIMDTDIGIGYRNAVSNGRLPSSNEEADPVIKGLKLSLFVQSLKNKSTTIEITDADLKALNELPEKSAPLDSYSIMGRIFSDETAQPRLVLEGMGGPSSINLLGRFAYLSPELETLCLDMAAAETALYQDAIVAEIAHLPQGRYGNILARPHFREYEIPYLAFSTLPAAQQVLLEDLYIGIVQQQVVLYSKRHNKRVIPRLSNAHNTSFDSLPVYHFLADLQHQNISENNYWSWDDYGNQDFLPRVVYKEVIVSPAQWNIYTRSLKKTTPENFHETIRPFNLPDEFVIKQADNELYIDLRTELGQATFMSFCQKYDRLKLVEFFADNANILGGYTNEFIIPYTRKESSQRAIPLKDIYLPSAEEQICSPLSEWVYFKLYTGRKFTDRLLTELVTPLIEKLKEDRIVRKWFFVRYMDPKDHLRIRFQLSTETQRAALLQTVHAHLNDSLQDHTIWEMQLSTYRKEVERYGTATMELCEEWFSHNSDLTLTLLPLMKQVNSATQVACVVYYIDTILSDFGHTSAEKTTFVKIQADSFSKEFHLESQKPYRTKLNDDFRNLYGSLREILQEDISRFPQPEAVAEIMSAIKENSHNSTPAITAISAHYANDVTRMETIVGSFIHMFINRLYTDNQRNTEMVNYYMLNKYYAAEIARSANHKNIPATHTQER